MECRTNAWKIGATVIGQRQAILEPQEQAHPQYPAYLFSVLKWLPFFAIGINDWPALASYMARIETRPSVMAAIEAEANAGRG
ncbi:hypothetical protein [Pseudomonas sp. D1-2]|uniref:hypothetical protein n=1 Tax=unclassified Pseudomonas TaxID=196821 RepID=UPI003DA998FC